MHFFFLSFIDCIGQFGGSRTRGKAIRNLIELPATVSSYQMNKMIVTGLALSARRRHRYNNWNVGLFDHWKRPFDMSLERPLSGHSHTFPWSLIQNIGYSNPRQVCYLSPSTTSLKTIASLYLTLLHYKEQRAFQSTVVRSFRNILRRLPWMFIDKYIWTKQENKWTMMATTWSKWLKGRI